MKSIIKENRPHLSENWIKTYTSIIKNLGKKINVDIQSGEDIINNLDKIKNELKDKDPIKRKTIYAALIVLCDMHEKNNKLLNNGCEELRKLMNDDISKFKEIENNQEMSTTQKNNWMDYNEVMQLYNNYKNNVYYLLDENRELTKKEFLKLNTFILLSCLLLIPPLRSLNFTEFKIKNIDDKKDNYMRINKKKYEFVFNVYKGSDKKGPWIVEIPKELYNIINKWTKFNKTEYL